MLQGWQGWPISARTVLFFGILGGAILFGVVSRVTSISFCGSKLPIPDGCNVSSSNKLVCEDCVVSWSYVDGNMLRYMAEQAVQETLQQNYPSTKENISCYLRGTKVDATKISSVKNNRYESTIIAFGIVNEHSVLVRLSVPYNILNNDDFPSCSRQIISLTE